MSISTIWEPRVSGRTRQIWPAAAPVVVALAYYLGAEAAFAIGTLTQQFAPFWPPNVVLLCAFLLAPRRYWPLYVAMAFPAHVLAEWGAAMPLPQLILAFVSNVSVALLNAIGLRWLLQGPSWLGTLRNASLYLLVAVVASPALVALFAGLEPTLSGGDPAQYWHFWTRWYLSNALGSLTLTPIFLAWFCDDLNLPALFSNRRRVIEASFLVVALIVGCGFAFDLPLTRSTEKFMPALLYLPIPLLLAAAVRFGARGASGAILIVTVEVLMLAMRGDAPFGNSPEGYGVLAVQLFLAVIAAPTILLAALVEELRRANERLSAVLDGISDCHYTLDRDGLITDVNAKGTAWWGAVSPEELIGRHFSEVTGETGSEPSLLRRAMESRIPGRDEARSADGRWVDIRAYPSGRGLNVFYHDTSERKAAEEAARATEAMLQSSLDALNAQIAILDSSGQIVAANAAWHRAAALLVQIGEHYFVGDNYLEECERARPHQRMVAAGLRRILRSEIDEYRCEYASDIVKGVWIQLRGTRFGASREMRLVVACEDITEVKAAETSLRQLTGKLLRLQDEERRRIARELHDATAQNLLGAILGIGQAIRLAPRLQATARAALEESRSLIEQSQREIRTVSYLLHPPMLDEAGLQAALRWLCDGFAKRTDIAVEVDLAPDIGRLATEIEATLFRVAQEALTNVHRHSECTKARVSLARCTRSATDPMIELIVEDDGKGMPPELAAAASSGNRSHNLDNLGIGLAGMRERLLQVGGSLEISTSARGTSVRVAASPST